MKMRSLAEEVKTENLEARINGFRIGFGGSSMKRIFQDKAVLIMAILSLGILFPMILPAQEEMTTNIHRYRDREVSTGYYEEYEVRPRHQMPFVGVPGISRGLFPYSPGGAEIRIRTRLADSHVGLKFYERRQCGDCHTAQASGHHTVRANLTCRQCHGGEPIAAINHYYSPMNPIRRHAYVCAKCHEGAGASFASYIVHEPLAGSLEARRSFSILYYTYWFMLVLLVGTLAFFIPHSFMLSLKELLTRHSKGGD